MDPIALTYDMCRRYASDHHQQLGVELHDKIQGWIRSRSLDKLTSCSSASPDTLYSREAFVCCRQIEAFFKKNVTFSEPERCEQAAQLSFEKAERNCRITNRRLDYYYLKRHRLDADLQSWLSKAEDYVSQTLGDFSKFRENIPKMLRVTTGATASHSRRQSLPHLKLRKRLACTSGAVPYLKATAKYFGYSDVRTVWSNVNRVEFVPKSWKTSRTIACEPVGNLPFQLAFDTYAKRRLLRRGIDLSDQTRNQRLAKEGSISGKFATIDLSMASDTIAFNTVAWLLPLPWFQYLNALRCPFGKGNGKIYQYAKFSSMGNGATFALETLIFAAACYAVGSRQYSVYGDDIVIETEHAENLLRFMRFLGFSVNSSKSYLSGPFRESCGTDYYQGKLVTPFYIRDLDDRKAVLSHNVNGLVQLGYPGSKMWELLLQIIEENTLPTVPANEATTSGVFVHVSHAYSKKLIKVKYWIPKFKALVPKSQVSFIRDSRTLFLWHLNALRRTGESDTALITSRTTAFEHKYVRKWVRWNFPAVEATEESMIMLFSDLIYPSNES